MAADAAIAPDRLRDSRDIVAVLRGGRHRAGRLVVLHSRDAVPLDGTREPSLPVTGGNAITAVDAGRIGPRVAVVASRKVGNAVNRNRAKRLLREAARRIDWAPGIDVVLVARNACASSTMPAVLAELEQLASELHVRQAAA